MKTITTTKELHTTTERISLVNEVSPTPKQGDKVELTTYWGKYYYYYNGDGWQPTEN